MKRELTSTSRGTLTNSDVMVSFPKVELHRHLEGTFSLKALHRAAIRNKLDVPRTFAEFKSTVQFPRESEPDFLTFLSLFRNDWYRSLADVEEIVYESVKELASDGLVYIELRFSPEHFALENDFDRSETTRIVISAADRAAAEIGLEIRYLITFNRSKQEVPEMLELYRRIVALEEPRIVGLDLAGDELNYPPELFRDFFSVVKDDGIYRATIHAGEVTPSAQIWSAIKDLGARRIGHGVAAIHDLDLQSFLADENIALEQCITSNYQTGSWADERHHPLGELHRRGVPVTINSDDPTIQGASLTDDYVKAASYFDFGVDDLVRLNERAIDTSFLDRDGLQTVRKRFRDAVNSFCSTHNL